jgi:hypothetical protein
VAGDLRDSGAGSLLHLSQGARHLFLSLCVFSLNLGRQVIGVSPCVSGRLVGRLHGPSALVVELSA